MVGIREDTKWPFWKCLNLLHDTWAVLDAEAALRGASSQCWAPSVCSGRVLHINAHGVTDLPGAGILHHHLCTLLS